MNFKILKNSSYLLFAQIIVKTIAFFYTIFLARNLGVENFGLYTVAMSYFVLISSFSDFGISRYLIKEVATNKSNLSQLLSNIIFLRLSSIVIIFGGFVLLFRLFDPDRMRAVLSLVAVMSIIPQAIGITFDNIFVAIQKISVSALAIIFTSVITTFTGVVFIISGLSTLGAVSAVLIGQILYAIFLLIFTIKENIQYLSPLSIKIIKDILIGSLPYGFLSLLGLLYFRIDSLILSYIKGPFDTGIYGVAYKFLEAVVIVPTAVSMAVFPVLVRMHQSSKGKIRNFAQRIIIYMGFTGVVVTVGFFFVLPKFIQAFLPNFFASIETIQILSLAIPFIFAHVTLSQVMLSADKFLKPLLFLSVSPLALNILLNVLFIPRYGYIGAAWITVFSDIFSLFILYLVVRKYLFNRAK